MSEARHLATKKARLRALIEAKALELMMTMGEYEELVQQEAAASHDRRVTATQMPQMGIDDGQDATMEGTGTEEAE